MSTGPKRNHSERSIACPAGVLVWLALLQPATADQGNWPAVPNCISPEEAAFVAQQLELYEARFGPLSRPEYPAEDGVPPPLPKLEFYPQAGNLFGDLIFTNFVDLNPAAGVVGTFECTDWAYDGHNGHDVALRSFSEQAIGVPVFAALEGTVVYVHDGEPDMNIVCNGLANAVIIDHGNGLLGEYWHLKTGSVTAVLGEPVSAGQQIGLVASSGCSTGPHLHFETRINAGAVFEPFAGPCRPGDSGWLDQPDLVTDTYVHNLYVTTTNPATVSFYGHGGTADPPSHNQVPLSAPKVYLILRGQRLPSTGNYRVRFYSPVGALGFDTGTVNYPNGQSAWYGGNSPTLWASWIMYQGFDVPGMHSTVGTWRVTMDINGVPELDAPIEVVAAPNPFFNRPPEPVTAVFDPPAPRTDQVAFCRAAHAVLYLDDVDWQVVRYRYVWKVDGEVVRDVTIAAMSDAIPRGTAPAGALLECTVTPSDGIVNGQGDTVSVVVQDALPPPTPDCNGNGVDDLTDVISGFSADANQDVTPDECQATRLYVNAAASGLDHGTSWADAYVDLQHALHAAASNPDHTVTEIWVAAGTYKPDEGSGDRTASFKLVDGVALYGGFAGDETQLAERDPAAHVTVLSGDLAGNDGPNFTNVSDNCYHVVDATGYGPDTRLDGFTVRGGNADATGYEYQYGGGLWSFTGAGLVVEQCTFSANRALAGGGAALGNGTATFRSCKFTGNATLPSSSSAGGALAIARCDDLAVDQSEFTNNTAAGTGGAVYVETSGVSFTRCHFAGDSAPYGGAAGLFSPTASSLDLPVLLTNCTFQSNLATAWGGAVYLDGSSAEPMTPQFANCLFVANQAAGTGGTHGGAIAAYDYSSPLLVNCTFRANAAGTSSGALMATTASNAVLRNCIFWNNAAPSGPQLGMLTGQFPASLTVSHCDVQGGQAGISGVSGGNSVIYGPDNIDSDPLFVDPPNGDLTLLPGSPCIDAGNNAYLPPDLADIDGDGNTAEPLPLDLADGPRIVAATVDMGAYELLVLGDMDCSGALDAADVPAFVQALLDPAGYAAAHPACDIQRGDLNGDGPVDGADVQPFVAAVFAP